MSSKAIHVSLLKAQHTSHSKGLKLVFETSDNSKSALTQFAYGILNVGDETGWHKHSTMDEYFYFIKGIGTFLIEENKIDIIPEIFVKVKANDLHNLISKSINFSFIYFGIDVSAALD